tara:strand:+ start:355 stop:495 length:141 start_codon:yes stop_codon:yes gene_type:complete
MQNIFSIYLFLEKLRAIIFIIFNSDDELEQTLTYTYSKATIDAPEN